MSATVYRTVYRRLCQCMSKRVDDSWFFRSSWQQVRRTTRRMRSAATPSHRPLRRAPPALRRAEGDRGDITGEA